MHNLLAAVTLVLLQQQTQSVVLSAGKAEEPCLNMRAGDRLEFSFSADAPLDFNIHYHVGEQLSFPVQNRAIKSAKDVYIAPENQLYCLMWSSSETAAAIQLDYSFRHYQNEDGP